MNSRASSQPDRPSSWATSPGRFWFAAALVFLVFFVAAGDRPPHVNEGHYLSRLKHFWDPSYCQGDLFLDSPDAHFTVVWLFGWVTRWMSLEVTAWIGRVLSWFLLACAWTRLTARITPHAMLAPLGASLLVAGTRHTHFAGEWIVGGFEAKTLAYGLVVFALADAIDRRWNRCWLLLGAASALHALVGGWSVVALGISAGLTGRLPSLGRMAPGLIGGAALSLAGVAPALALNAGVSTEVVAEANETYVFFRLPHHLAPLSKPPEWVFDRAWRHVSAIGALALLHLFARRDPAAQHARLLAGYAWAAEGLSLCGFAIELIGWDNPDWAASLLKYYWFRLADIATPIAVITLLVHYASRAIDERRGLVLVSALAVLAAWYVGFHAIRHSQRPPAPAEARLRDPAAWAEICDWIKASTETDAVFFVPRHSHSFKWRAERAEVVTYKDVPQDAASMVEWRRRFDDVFLVGEWANGRPRYAGSLAEVGTARMRTLAAELGARYALDEIPRRDREGALMRRRMSLPIVKRVGPYVLYDLAPPPPAD